MRKKKIGSAFIGEREAEWAIERVMRAIEGLIEFKTIKRSHLHIVILNPGISYSSGAKFTDAILYEESLGDKKKWEHPYDKIALKKTEVSWRTGLASQYIVTQAPHLLVDCDTYYFGSAVMDGIIVGVSGVQAYYDQMIAEWIASAIKAIGIERYQELSAKNDNFVVAKP